MSVTTLTYIVPVHNQEEVLGERMARLLERLGSHPGAAVIMVENGSTDRSAEIAAALVRDYRGSVDVSAVSSATGLGNAYRRGIALATGDTIVLTAADLPFGFSDLEAWQALTPQPRLALGSKSHPKSVVDVAWTRRVMSAGFWLLRRALISVDARDTQGTMVIERRLAQQILPQLRCADYLVSTEIVAWAARWGVEARELPVHYPRQPGRSTVSPLADSLRMAAGLWYLRRRLRAGRAAAP